MSNTPKPGTIVHYTHPDWGPSRARVLYATEGRVLVQDLSPDGAREWLDIRDITRREET